jgi:hypothetical protein
VNDLIAVSRVYECLAACEVHRYRISHEPFNTFCLRLQRLQHALNELGDDEYWRPILQYLCRFRYLASATPSPFNDPGIFSPTTCGNIEELLSSRGPHLYPDFAVQTLALLDLHRDLAATIANPLLSAISERLTDVSTLLVRESGLVARTEHILASCGRAVRAVAPVRLKSLDCLTHLIVVGPARWYPEYVFTAPRARRIDLLQYTWMRDKPVNLTSFLVLPGKTPRRGPAIAPYQDETIDMIDADAVLPLVNWQQIVQTARETAEETQDDVDARLFILESGRAVFLEADEQATARTIDVNNEEQPVQRVAVTELTPGMFVLLRTSGGGDYVVPVADRILGTSAENVRTQQRQWKQRLRELAKTEGITAISRRLREHGSRIAGIVNVRNWMSERSIKTANYEDFAAIMAVIGEAQRAKDFWNSMCVIDRAHRKAGFHISKLLLKQVKATDLRELELQGTLEFTLPEEEGGSITAFRIEQIAPDLYRIPVTRIGHVFYT